MGVIFTLTEKVKALQKDAGNERKCMYGDRIFGYLLWCISCGCGSVHAGIEKIYHHESFSWMDRPFIYVRKKFCSICSGFR